MAKSIVLFDVDETLLENNRPSPVKGKIKRKIGHLKEMDYLVGICTHRPWRDASQIYKTYKMNGPAICEGGNVFGYRPHSLSTPKSNKLHSLLAKELKRYFLEKDLLIKVCLSASKRSLKKNTAIINKRRIASATIYFSSKFERDIEEVANNLKNRLKKKGYTASVEKKTHKVIVTKSGITKIGTIHKKLMKTKRRIFLVTDLEILPKRIPKGIILCSVGTDPDFNSKCDFRSKQPASRGVLEALDFITGEI